MLMAIEAQKLYKDNYVFCDVGSQYWMESNPIAGVNGFYFKKQELFQQKMHRPCFDMMIGHPASRFHDVATQMEEQRREVDRFITYQNEKLRFATQEMRRQQIVSILRNCEAKAEILMKQKDQEIAQALNKKIELENALKTMEIECRKWQQMAMENEDVVESLKDTIDQYKESTYFTNQAEDSESCCGNKGNGVKKGEDNICKYCDIRYSRVVFLPCRHFCCCEFCERFLATCPICGIVKKASIEAIF